MMRVRFWGVRGSIPTPGPNTVRIGGNTSCVEVRCGEKLIILDGGTGLRPLGDDLLKQMPITAAIFFSHVHWDHIQGFPFFSPAFVARNTLDLFGGKNLTSTLSDTLSGQMNFPNFPVTLEQMGATIRFHHFDDGQIVDLGAGVSVRALKLNHPDGSYGYRIEYEGRALAYCTDTEHRDSPDEHVIELARMADIFIYDTQYLPEEYSGQIGAGSKVGWGHSTFEVGSRLARLAGAKRLVLFHHDPSHSDDLVLEKERRCRELFPASDAAREGLVYEF